MGNMAAMLNDISIYGFCLTIFCIVSTHAQGPCEPLQAPDNGMTSCSSNGVTTVCKATCNIGFGFVTGETSITKTCTDGVGSWQGGKVFPSCSLVSPTKTSAQVVCSPLRSPTNGVVSCSGNGIAVTCTATCDSGYKFKTGESSVQKTCSEVSGGWAGGSDLPECLPSTYAENDILDKCNSPLLPGVADNKISASSVWSGARTYYFGPERARINSTVTTSGSLVLAGAWRPANNTLDQYIQVELVSLTRVTSIATAGRVVLSGDTADEYVTRYRVMYSRDGAVWEPYSTATVSDQFLDGNTDNEKTNINTLACPFDAKYVRINPLAWHEHIALRFELYGCVSDGSVPECSSNIVIPTAPTPTPLTTATTTTIAPPPKTLCHAIPPPTNGAVNCEQRADQIICVASCSKGYIFETKETLVKRTCMTATGTWPASQHIPACIRDARPDLLPTNNYTHGCLTTESDCNRIGNGDFQACGGCHYFSTCSEGFLYIRACPERLLFDAVSNVCDYHSRTCPNA